MADVDYRIEKYAFEETDETPRLTRQWRDVLEECRELQAGPGERLRIALLNVDYVTSFELPFRLLLVRTPQLIAGLRDDFQLSQKSATFNGKRFGCVYSLKEDMSSIPDTFSYRMTTRINRIDKQGISAEPWRQIARTVKAPRERLKQALESGLQITALDGLFWFGIQRMAAEICVLRKKGMRIISETVLVQDNLTGTTRLVPVYTLAAYANKLMNKNDDSFSALKFINPSNSS
ncbi:helix-turn-helix domain-containing protein [Enterobacter asburiae]|nr:helix-turn-helix domain-containing protein [Enterobacter asburiae]